MQLRLCMHEFFAGRGIFARVFNLKGAYSLAVYFIIIIIILFIFFFWECSVDGLQSMFETRAIQ